VHRPGGALSHTARVSLAVGGVDMTLSRRHLHCFARPHCGSAAARRSNRMCLTTPLCGLSQKGCGGTSCGKGSV
jgi:hypothetical protein